MIHQLRTPAGMKLQDLIAQISLTVEESIKREVDGIEAPAETQQILSQKLTSIISPYLISFAQCGKFEICMEGVEGDNLRSDDRIFILVLPEDFQGLVNQISVEMLEQMRLYLDQETAQALDQRLRSSLLRDFGKYLFTNPVCGYHEVCRRSIPVDPWR